MAWATGNDALVTDPAISGHVHTKQGQWRTKIQQVFVARTRTLTRRLYTIWDPEPSRDLDFVWTPDNSATDKPGRVNGRGHLIWRVKGIPAYEHAAVFAEYRGRFRNGRIEGRGAFLDRDGLLYEGEWRNGLMEGHGKLKLPGGDEYVGRFRRGKANGAGHFIDITGEVYEGPFLDGHRHGRGKTTLASGQKYTSQWAAGREAAASRLVRVAQTPTQSLPGGADDIRIGITIDKRLPPVSGGGTIDRVSRDFWYSVSNTTTGISIEPAEARLMEAWKGSGELPNRWLSPSPSKAELIPLTLGIDVQNRSSSPVQVEGVYLDVQSSVTDLQPEITFSSTTDATSRMPIISFQNRGWGAAEQAKAQFSLLVSKPAALPASFSYARTLGNIERDAQFDMGRELASAGVDVELLKRNARGVFTCKAPSAQPCLSAKPTYDVWERECKPAAEACLAELRRSGIFGSLAQQVSVEGSTLKLHVAGALDYTWRGVSGVVSTSQRPFYTQVHLGTLAPYPWGAEGGDAQIISTTTQELRLDASAYRIAIAYRASIASGRNGRLLMSIEADKSSSHDYAVVIQLTDGREIRSRQIKLLYYKPNFLPEPATDHSALRWYNNFELVGDDLRTVSQADCLEACKSDRACVAYTLNKQKKTCALKASIGTLRLDSNSVSFRMPGTAVPLLSSAALFMEELRDHAFMRAGYGIHTRTSAAECQQRCTREANCIAYSFWKKTLDCHLHNGFESYTANPDVDSGIKHQRR